MQMDYRIPQCFAYIGMAIKGNVSLCQQCRLLNTWLIIRIILSIKSVICWCSKNIQGLLLDLLLQVTSLGESYSRKVSMKMPLHGILLLALLCQIWYQMGRGWQGGSVWYCTARCCSWCLFVGEDERSMRMRCVWITHNTAIITPCPQHQHRVHSKYVHESICKKFLYYIVSVPDFSHR